MKLRRLSVLLTVLSSSHLAFASEKPASDEDSRDSSTTSLDERQKPKQDENDEVIFWVNYISGNSDK